MIKTIGKGAKDNKRKTKEPTDEEKSEARLKAMETKQNS
jgi:hypothetical protein